VGWKEYFDGVVSGNPKISTFKEVERGSDYVILFTTDRGESYNFYLKITNVDIKWGNDKTHIDWLLDNGKWTLFNFKNNGKIEFF
jgi:hypothetical protein